MAFITAETRSDLIELSVAMLKQAPSAALLEELIALSVGGGSLADAADHIAKTAAFKAEYPSFQTAEQYAAEIFDNITTGGTVTADIRTAVIELATGMLTSGSVTKAGLALAIAEYLAAPAALLNTDFADIAQSFQNRADAAEYFVVTKELGGSTDAELAAAIASVTSDAATLTAANTAADATASAEAVVAGQSIPLTTGLDTGASFTGGTGDDTFSAVAVNPASGSSDATSLNAGDSIDGGAGTDKLSLAISASAATVATVASTNVEEYVIYNNSGASRAIDTSLMKGLTDLYVMGGNEGVSFTGLNSLPNVHLTSADYNVSVATASTIGLGDSDEVTIALTSAIPTRGAASPATPVALTYDGIETFNVVTAGSTTGSATRTLTLDSNQLETLNLSGAAGANITVQMQGAANVEQVGTVDASEMTGALLATITAGSSGLLDITGGAGNDTLTIGAMSEDYTIDGGAGLDTLVVTSAAYDEDSTTGQVGDGVTNVEVLLVSGTADLAAFSNNTFAALASSGSATISEIGTGAVSLTMVTTGTTVKLDRATDGAADEATVTFGGATEFAVTTLNVADEESLTINSGALVSTGTNTIGTLTGTDLTSLTIAGNRDLTITDAITATALAKIDASGLTGTGTALSINASNSTADMTVTAGAGVEANAGDPMNVITTGRGDDVVTGGAYRDNITTNNGDDKIDAGDGNNSVNAGYGDDTITGGAGNDTLDGGNGDDVITGLAGNDSLTGGAGDDSVDGGTGNDTISVGAGDDTVVGGEGNDTLYATSVNADDDIDGGAGTDSLKASAIAATAVYPALSNFVTAELDEELVLTDIETVYLAVQPASANSGASSAEILDLSSSSGLKTLYLDMADGDNDPSAASDSYLTVKNFDGSKIFLSELDSDPDSVASLTLDGTGQSSLTAQLRDIGQESTSAVVVTGVDALTIAATTSSTSSGAITQYSNAIGTVTADSVGALTLSTPGQSVTSLSTALTTGAISADAAETLTISVGAKETMTTGVIDTADDLAFTVNITLKDDSSLVLGNSATADLDLGDSDVDTMTITMGVGSSLTGADSTPSSTTDLDIVADTIDDFTMTVGAASSAYVNLRAGVTGSITASAGSSLDIDVIGVTLEDTDLSISGRGELNDGPSAVAATAMVLYGADVELSLSGWTDTDASTLAFVVDGSNIDSGGSLTFTGAAGEENIVTGSGGDDDLTGGNGDDVLKGGAGADTLTSNIGTDVLVGGAGQDTFELGTGDDIVYLGTAGVVTVATTQAAVAADPTGTPAAVAEITTITLSGTFAVGEVLTISDGASPAATATHTVVAGDTLTSIAASLVSGITTTVWTETSSGAVITMTESTAGGSDLTNPSVTVSTQLTSTGASDSAAVVFADGGASSSALDDGDKYTGAVDIVTGAASGDTIALPGALASASLDGTTGAAASGKYGVVLGDFVAATGVFTVDTTDGADTLVVYHDATAGLDAIVLVGVDDVSGITIG